MMLKDNDLVFCSVKSIEGTTVFVELEDKTQGSIVFSEIAAGRIRNIREYVHPGKKIVCKILKVLPDHLELSFRRVTGSERDEILERYKKAKTFENMIKAVIPNSEGIIKNMKEQYEIWEFYDQLKENPSLLDKFLKKSDAENLLKLFHEKKEKEKTVKKTIILKSNSESGLSDIKEILDIKNASIRYLGSSKFSIESTARDFKEAEHSVDGIIAQIESKAKEKKAIFELKEK